MSYSSTGGADKIWGEYGYDRLYGDARSMSGSARGGADRIYGGYDNDSLFGDAYSMSATTTGGADWLYGDNDSDTPLRRCVFDDGLGEGRRGLPVWR